MELVCVTGGAGFLASHVVDQLHGSGRFRVRATVRSKEPARVAHLEGKCELFEADLMREGSFRDAFAGCACVIHVASPFQTTAADPQRDIVDPALLGTRNVVSEAVRAGVRRVVLTSSVAAVRSRRKPSGRGYDETDWNNGATLQSSPYPLSKTLAERAAWELIEAAKGGAASSGGGTPDLVAILPSLVLGPPLSARTDSFSVRLVARMLDGTHAASGAPAACYAVVDVRDAAAAHVAALAPSVPAGRYIVAGEARTRPVLEIARLLAPEYARFPLPARSAGPPGAPIAYENAKGARVLKMRYRPAKRTLLDAAAALVRLGVVPDRP